MSGHAEERKATQRLPARARHVWAKMPHTPQQFTAINTFLRNCCRWQSHDLIPLWSEQWASLTPPLTTANVFFSQMETDKLEVHGDGFVFSGTPPWPQYKPPYLRESRTWAQLDTVNSPEPYEDQRCRFRHAEKSIHSPENGDLPTLSRTPKIQLQHHCFWILI